MTNDSLLVLATGNRHKVEEIQSMFDGALQIRPYSDWMTPLEIEETGDAFAENALIKARVVSEAMRRALVSEARGPTLPSTTWVLADDSGLEVDALDGAPGVKSARYAAEDGTEGNAPDAANNAKLLAALADVPLNARTARFRCVLALVNLATGEERLFDGACEGRIGFEADGDGGFGYDPLFYPDGHDASFARLGSEIKDRISHRARALQALRQGLQSTAG